LSSAGYTGAAPATAFNPPFCDTEYDDLALMPWKFSPLAPLVSCGP